MSRFVIVIVALFLTAIVGSCGGRSSAEQGKSGIEQKEDGAISLNIETAIVLDNDTNPGNNTAEWRFVINKPGRYEVWLSSLTLDTMDMRFGESVRISLNDDRIEARPVGNKISACTEKEMSKYHKAESLMGTFYIETTGEHFLQVISERIHESLSANDNANGASHTIIKAVTLNPMTY